MKKFGNRSSILVGLCGAALVVSAIGCGSSSTGSDASGNGGTSAGGTGGGSGGGGGAAGPALAYDFTSSLQGFSINTYHDTNSTNLGYALAPDAGVDASSLPTLTWDSTDGKPNPGCSKVVVTYTGYNQYIDVKVGLPTVLNLKGKTLRAQVQLASATGGTFPGGAILEADTTATYSYGGSSAVQLATPGVWSALALSLDTVTPQPTQTYDDTMVIQIGIQFYAGSPPTDGGTTLGPLEATFLIDTIEAQ